MKAKQIFYLALGFGCVFSYLLKLSAPDTSKLDTWAADDSVKRPTKIAMHRPKPKGNPLQMNSAAVAQVRPAQPPAAHPPKVEAPIVKASDDAMAFSRTLSETWNTLPRADVMRGKTDAEVHQAPPEVYEASGKIGAISASVHENPALVPQAMDFFDRCARDRAFLQSTRVLCFRNLKFWSNRTGLQIPREEEFGKEITQIAASMPPARTGVRPR